MSYIRAFSLVLDKLDKFYHPLSELCVKFTSNPTYFPGEVDASQRQNWPRHWPNREPFLHTPRRTWADMLPLCPQSSPSSDRRCSSCESYGPEVENWPFHGKSHQCSADWILPAERRRASLDLAARFRAYEDTARWHFQNGLCVPPCARILTVKGSAERETSRKSVEQTGQSSYRWQQDMRRVWLQIWTLFLYCV